MDHRTAYLKIDIHWLANLHSEHESVLAVEISQPVNRYAVLCMDRCVDERMLDVLESAYRIGDICRNSSWKFWKERSLQTLPELQRQRVSPVTAVLKCTSLTIYVTTGQRVFYLDEGGKLHAVKISTNLEEPLPWAADTYSELDITQFDTINLAIADEDKIESWTLDGIFDDYESFEGIRSLWSGCSTP